MEMPLNERRVVHDGVHAEGSVDGAAYPADSEQNHRQRDAREERITPRQFADPVEPARGAARAEKSGPPQGVWPIQSSQPVAPRARPATSSDAVMVNAVTKLGNRIAKV